MGFPRVVLPLLLLSLWPALAGAGFDLVDASDGALCPDGLFVLLVRFEQAGLPQGSYSVTITESHLGTRDPGSWPHVFEFTVGDPLTGPDGPAWGAVKALYR